VGAGFEQVFPEAYPEGFSQELGSTPEKKQAFDCELSLGVTPFE